MTIDVLKNDSVITAFEQKRATVQKLTNERAAISQKKEQRRHEFSLERHNQDDKSLFFDAEGRDVGRAAHEKEMHELDASEGKILRELIAEQSSLIR